MKKVNLVNKRFFIALSVLLCLVFVLTIINKPMFYAYAYEIEDIYYQDAYNGVQANESIPYSTKTVTTYALESGTPEYSNTNPNLTNTCANVAGAVIIGYYDRNYTNLIPNYDPGRYVGSIYLYINSSPSVNDLIASLYTYMGTNNPNPGTTQTSFKNGIVNYVKDHGNYPVSFGNVLNSNGSFSLSNVDYALHNGYPVALYLSNYNIITSIQDKNSTVTLVKTNCTGNHIMVAFGYKEYKYYNAAGQNFRTDIYLMVATGFTSISGYCLVGSYTTLNAAEYARIY